MKIGLFDQSEHGDRQLSTQFDERLTFIQAADEAGFYCLHLAEHHSTPLNMVPVPGVFLGAVARATSRIPDWRTVTMRVPARAGAYTFVIDRGTGGQPQKQALLTLSASGEELGWEPVTGPGRSGLRTILRYTHTGEGLGIAGQTLAGLVSAGAVVLVWTGSALALRRFGAWRRRRRSVAARRARLTLPPCP